VEGSTALQQHHNSSETLYEVGGGVGTVDREGEGYPSSRVQPESPSAYGRDIMSSAG
jgi:hypothetical protein